MYNLNDDAIIFLILLVSIFIPFIYLLVKLWIEQICLLREEKRQTRIQSDWFKKLDKEMASLCNYDE